MHDQSFQSKLKKKMGYTYEYPRPAVTTDALVIATHEGIEHILLIQRKYEPYKDCWALPGGFVDMDEELETACARELEEETGLSELHLEQFGTFGTVNRDPRGRTISVVYYATTDKLLKVKGSDDAALALWFPLNNLPCLAFDHQIIIESFLRKWQSKIKTGIQHQGLQ
jgi:8-oxo-dGTP diphosphatase